MLLTRYYFAGEFEPYLETFRSYAYRRRRIQRGEYLCTFAEPLDRVYYIVNGVTRLSVLHDNGEEKLFGFWAHDSIFPIICSMQDFHLEYSILLKAETNTEVLEFTVDTFTRILTDHNAIMVEVIDHYCRFCNMLLFSSATRDYENTRTRICNVIYTHLYFTKEKEMVSLSQSDIASLIGTTRVTVARELAFMRKKGLIETKRGKIRVLDFDGVKNEASELTK